MNRTTTTLLAATAGAAALIAAAPARAQMMHVPESDWRQTDRHDAIIKAAAKPTFLVELRFGPYLPDIDSAVPGGATPFKDIFGLNCGATPTPTVGPVSPRFLFGAEFDYLPVRIPYIGTVGPGVGWSFTQFSNQALRTGTSMCSPENTTLTIMPMHASLALRADELMRRTGIPIVPYGKFGVGVAWWRASTDTGTEKICGTKAAPTRCVGSAPVVIGNGDGLTPSLHFAVGVMLALNFLEPQASARLDETTGVHHPYIFGEYYNDQLTLVANAMHVGASSFVGGLAVDF
jgi:hypothetical protein